MDYKVKGISWVGNAYQKFEAMCLEVEDAVCQETAKYVGTQVQTVGSSVKKFYAEVLQDLLPPSSLDTKNPEGSALLLEDFGIYEKPKLPFQEDSVKDNTSTRGTSEKNIAAFKSSCQEQIDEVDICKRSKAETEKYSVNKRLPPIEMSDVITSSGKSLSQVSLRSRVHSKNDLLPSLSVNPVIAADSRLPLEENDCDQMCRKSQVPIETGSRKENFALLDVAPVGKDISQESSFRSVRKGINPNACDTQTKTASVMLFDPPTCDTRKNTGTSCSNRLVEIGCAADTSSSYQSSSLVLPAVSCESKAVENGLSTFDDTSTESDAMDNSATTDRIPLKGSLWNETEQFSDAKSDDHSEMEEGDGIVELAPETIDEFQNAKLEESCIVVDSKELPFIPHQGVKHRSYKKKIRDVLASRMRLAKKQEYEQLAIWHETNIPPIPESSTPSLLTKDLKKSPSQDNGESEWELL